MLSTEICRRFGIQHPIVQAGMGAFTSAELAAAVSNAGALGTIGAANRSAEGLGAEIDRVRRLTRLPFAVNHLVSNLDKEAFSVTLKSRVPVISFALGDPGDLVRQAHDSGALVMHQVHTVTQAKQAVDRGVNVLIAQGGEAGGFGQYVGTFVLLPQVVDAVRPVPVLAAGGIADGRGLAAALLLGAQGVNLGTRFLATAEAPVSEGYKKTILEAQSEDAVKVEVWNDFMPVPGRDGYGTVPRAIRTWFIERWQGQRVDAKKNAEMIRAELTAAAEQGTFHELVPFAGQTVGLINEIAPAGEIVRRIVEEARQLLDDAPKLAT